MPKMITLKGTPERAGFHDFTSVGGGDSAGRGYGDGISMGFGDGRGGGDGSGSPHGNWSFFPSTVLTEPPVVGPWGIEIFVEKGVSSGNASGNAASDQHGL